MRARKLGKIRLIKGATNTVYLLSYIKEMLQTYLKEQYNVSYREQKKVHKESEMLMRYIANSKRPIIKMMRRVNRRLQRESR
jgi:hypothetical protein